MFALIGFTFAAPAPKPDPQSLIVPSFYSNPVVYSYPSYSSYPYYSTYSPYSYGMWKFVNIEIYEPHVIQVVWQKKIKNTEEELWEIIKKIQEENEWKKYQKKIFQSFINIF